MKPWRCSVSDQARASAIWPTAAAAWLSSSLSGPRGRSRTRAAERDGAGGDDEEVAPAGGERGEVGGERIEPAGLQALLVDEQRRADLDDDPAEGVELGGHGRAGVMSVWAKSLPLNEERRVVRPWRRRRPCSRRSSTWRDAAPLPKRSKASAARLDTVASRSATGCDVERDAMKRSSELHQRRLRLPGRVRTRSRLKQRRQAPTSSLACRRWPWSKALCRHPPPALSRRWRSCRAAIIFGRPNSSYMSLWSEVAPGTLCLAASRGASATTSRFQFRSSARLRRGVSSRRPRSTSAATAHSRREHGATHGLVSHTLPVGRCNPRSVLRRVDRPRRFVCSTLLASWLALRLSPLLATV